MLLQPRGVTLLAHEQQWCPNEQAIQRLRGCNIGNICAQSAAQQCCIAKCNGLMHAITHQNLKCSNFFHAAGWGSELHKIDVVSTLLWPVLVSSMVHKTWQLNLAMQSCCATNRRKIYHCLPFQPSFSQHMAQNETCTGVLKHNLVLTLISLSASHARTYEVPRKKNQATFQISFVI